jgi:hypothetical protein
MKTMGLGVVAHVRNPTYSAGRDKRMWFEINSGKTQKQARYDDAHLFPQLLRRRLEDHSLRLAQIKLV